MVNNKSKVEYFANPTNLSIITYLLYVENTLSLKTRGLNIDKDDLQKYKQTLMDNFPFLEINETDNGDTFTFSVIKESASKWINLYIQNWYEDNLVYQFYEHYSNNPDNWQTKLGNFKFSIDKKSSLKCYTIRGSQHIEAILYCVLKNIIQINSMKIYPYNEDESSIYCTGCAPDPNIDEEFEELKENYLYVEFRLNLKDLFDDKLIDKTDTFNKFSENIFGTKKQNKYNLSANELLILSVGEYLSNETSEEVTYARISAEILKRQKGKFSVSSIKQFVCNIKNKLGVSCRGIIPILLQLKDKGIDIESIDI